MFERKIIQVILKRLKEPRKFIQVLIGPRQAGKTTTILQAIKILKLPTHYASADTPTLENQSWLLQQWQIARTMFSNEKEVILILDEIQKIHDWPNLIKKLWDEDTQRKLNIKVVVLGSAPLLMQKGLSESLAGRFEIIPFTHWSFLEMHKAFKWSLDKYIFFGGYPGAASLIDDEERWRRYIYDSLIETTLSRDILLLTRIEKPALLRQLFMLGAEYSSQILSFQKIVGQLADAGNTTTIAHYLELLSSAGLLTGIYKFSGKKVLQRSSSPKLMICNTALMSAINQYSFPEIMHQKEYWGRLVESAVGAYLVNQAIIDGFKVFYWREGNYEVDFVLTYKKSIVALEVKSGIKNLNLPGLNQFHKKYSQAKLFCIGENGFTLNRFFEMPLMDLFA